MILISRLLERSIKNVFSQLKIDNSELKKEKLRSIKKLKTKKILLIYFSLKIGSKHSSRENRKHDKKGIFFFCFGKRAAYY